MSNPNITIVIPTFNSVHTLPFTLASIRLQSFSGGVEVVVVDGYSSDGTVEVAEAFGARVLRSRGGLLWARYVGHLAARGDVEVLLDSDQVLARDALERVVEAVEGGCELVILGESSFRVSTPIEAMFYADRRLVHSIRDWHPVHGVLLARGYPRWLLDEAFKRIRRRLPLEVMYRVVSQDHAVIYYEAWRASRTKRVCIVEDAVFHFEPSSLRAVLRKFYRYGLTEHELARYYPELVYGKRTPRKPSPHPEALAAMALWLLKAVGYAAGRLKYALTR